MYNIAITKEGKTDFYKGTGDNPNRYPTLADALVSAQYLGLTRQDVELHFVKEGTSAASITKTVTGMARQQDGSGEGGTDVPLDRMNRGQLAAYAEEKGIAFNVDGTKKEILAAIREAEKGNGDSGDSRQQDGSGEDNGDRRE